MFISVITDINGTAMYVKDNGNLTRNADEAETFFTEGMAEAWGELMATSIPEHRRERLGIKAHGQEI